METYKGYDVPKHKVDTRELKLSSCALLVECELYECNTVTHFNCIFHRGNNNKTKLEYLVEHSHITKEKALEMLLSQ